MKEYKINYELSKEIYEKTTKRRIKILPKLCYRNCYNVATKLDELDIYSNKCKIGFCYLKISSFMLFVRHCVIITNDGELIDVTPFSTGLYTREELEEETYYMFEELEATEYCKRIVIDKGFTDNRAEGNDLEAYKIMAFNKDYGLCQFAESDYLDYIYPKLIVNKELQKELDERMNNLFNNSVIIDKNIQ